MPTWAPPLSAKQFRVLNSRARIMLLVGPRKTGKSVAAGHKVCRHLWDTNRASVGVFVTSYKVGMGGSWQDLVDICIPRWIESGMLSDDGQNTFEFATADSAGTPGPKMDGKTRTPYFEIVNRHGTISKCHLFSIDNENEIEAKVKQLRLSMVWVVELSTFKTRDIFRLTLLQLRSMDCPFEDMQWISDTNPSEEGTDSWIYQTFYTARNKPDAEQEEWVQRVVEKMEVVEIYLDDNPFLRQEEIDELKWTYLDDLDGYARHVEGKWKKSTGRRGYIFADTFVEQIHVIPDAIDVDKNTATLYTGWDPGILFSAAVCGEKRIIDGHSFWFILDELVSVDEELGLRDFAIGFFEKLVALETFYKKQWPNFNGFHWENWSDPNVLTLNHPSLSGAASAEIHKLTGGQISLQGAIKGSGSVESGLLFIRRLFREQRIFIGENCPNLIEAIKKVKHGTRKYIEEGDPYKHVLDALRYLIVMESLEELDNPPRPKSSERKIIQVRL